ncbi:MAG: hypothetical protein JRJ03_00380 [Deltaproteobacteria bacterium]|nr:hypothetical protein [Deltaproteobacteria bacterium]
MKFFHLRSGTRDRIDPLALVMLCLFLILQGCGAAAIPILYAGAAFDAYKIVEFSTGGKAKISFEESATLDKESLSLIKSLAIYPAGGGSLFPQNSEKTKMAELLQKESSYHIITPHSVSEILPEQERHLGLGTRTEEEKMTHIAKLCQDLKADAMLLISYGGFGHNISIIKRSEIKVPFEIELIAQDGRYIWQQKGELIIESGAKWPTTEEKAQVFSSTVAEKFLEEAREI